MKKQTERDMIVRAIIGDIPVAFSADDFDVDEIEPLTDEEVEEFENLPPFELTPEQHERGMKVVRWVLYSIEMQKRGLPHLDRHEYMNMAIEPTAPEANA